MGPHGPGPLGSSLPLDDSKAVAILDGASLETNCSLPASGQRNVTFSTSRQGGFAAAITVICAHALRICLCVCLCACVCVCLSIVVWQQATSQEGEWRAQSSCSVMVCLVPRAFHARLCSTGLTDGTAASKLYLCVWGGVWG